MFGWLRDPHTFLPILLVENPPEQYLIGLKRRYPNLIQKLMSYAF